LSEGPDRSGRKGHRRACRRPAASEVGCCGAPPKRDKHEIWDPTLRRATSDSRRSCSRRTLRDPDRRLLAKEHSPAPVWRSAPSPAPYGRSCEIAEPEPGNQRAKRIRPSIELSHKPNLPEPLHRRMEPVEAHRCWTTVRSGCRPEHALELLISVGNGNGLIALVPSPASKAPSPGQMSCVSPGLAALTIRQN
jgi:hypothetical protein